MSQTATGELADGLVGERLMPALEDHLSQAVLDALSAARVAAASCGQLQIIPQQLLAAVLSQPTSEAVQLLKFIDVHPNEIVEELGAASLPPDACPREVHEVTLGRRVRHILERARLEAQVQNEPVTGTHHVLMAMLGPGMVGAAAILGAHGVTPDRLRHAIERRSMANAALRRSVRLGPSVQVGCFHDAAAATEWLNACAAREHSVERVHSSNGIIWFVMKGMREQIVDETLAPVEH